MSVLNPGSVSILGLPACKFALPSGAYVVPRGHVSRRWSVDMCTSVDGNRLGDWIILIEGFVCPDQDEQVSREHKDQSQEVRSADFKSLSLRSQTRWPVSQLSSMIQGKDTFVSRLIKSKVNAKLNKLSHDPCTGLDHQTQQKKTQYSIPYSSSTSNHKLLSSRSNSTSQQ